MVDGRQYQAGEDMDARARVKRLEQEVADRDEEIAALIDAQADTREARDNAEQRAQRAEAECERLREALEGIERRTRGRLDDPGPCVDCVWGVASDALATPPPETDQDRDEIENGQHPEPIEYAPQTPERANVDPESGLKPCPFCGGRAMTRTGEECAIAQCLNVSAHRLIVDGDNDAANEVTQMWNMRPAPTKQAHGDALAASRGKAREHFETLLGDLGFEDALKYGCSGGPDQDSMRESVEIIRQALTVSGVRGHSITADDVMTWARTVMEELEAPGPVITDEEARIARALCDTAAQDSGVPYVPEELKQLVGWMRDEAITPAQCAVVLDQALASAPADGRKPVPGVVRDHFHAVRDCLIVQAREYEYGDEDNPNAIACRSAVDWLEQVVAAAPQRGGE